MSVRLSIVFPAAHLWQASSSQGFKACLRFRGSKHFCSLVDNIASTFRGTSQKSPKQLPSMTSRTAYEVISFFRAT